MRTYFAGRRNIMGRGMVMVFFLSLGGLTACRFVAPYEPGPNVELPDRGLLETQLPPPDFASPSDVAKDVPTLFDMGLPEAPIGPDDASYRYDWDCKVPTFTNQCGGPANCPNLSIDKDCDGLPNERDPAETVCQPLLVSEDFAQDPVSGSAARWTSNDTTKLTWTCGKETFAAGAMLTLANANLLQSTTTGPYLVEARFTLGTEDDPTNWSVGIEIGPHATRKFTCTVWVNKIDGVRNPVTHLNAISPGCAIPVNAQNATPKGNGKGVNGETYILQFYYDTKANAHCRVYREDNVTANTAIQSVIISHTDCKPTRLDTFSVYTSGRAATFSYIRAFAYPK